MVFPGYYEVTFRLHLEKYQKYQRILHLVVFAANTMTVMAENIVTENGTYIGTLKGDIG